jgi:hypothetical protein
MCALCILVRLSAQVIGARVVRPLRRRRLAPRATLVYPPLRHHTSPQRAAARAHAPLDPSVAPARARRQVHCARCARALARTVRLLVLLRTHPPAHTPWLDVAAAGGPHVRGRHRAASRVRRGGILLSCGVILTDRGAVRPRLLWDICWSGDVRGADVRRRLHLEQREILPCRIS